jgi:hypothetical protein
MKIVKHNSKIKLLEFIKRANNSNIPFSALYFNFSKLGVQFKTKYQIKIAIYILKKIFDHIEVQTFVLDSLDIVVIYKSANESIANNAIFQMRYLFMNDKLAYDNRSVENHHFCNRYDLSSAKALFDYVCNDLYITNKIHSRILDYIYINPIYALNPNNVYNIIYSRIYLNNKLLDKYFSQEHKERLLLNNINHTIINKTNYLCINLNPRTVITGEFEKFNIKFDKLQRSSIIIEFNIDQIFKDISFFKEIKNQLHDLGYILCIGNIDSQTLAEFEIYSLNMDLATLKYHDKLSPIQNQRILEFIENFGVNRTILSNCGNKESLDYGLSNNLKLFEGKYIDKIATANKY